MYKTSLKCTFYEVYVIKKKKHADKEKKLFPVKTGDNKKNNQKKFSRYFFIVLSYNILYNLFYINYLI